jgi:hypothetical protein
MKYDALLCTGQPRSGTHYITALISLNFLNNKDYLKIYRSHESVQLIQNSQTAYFYIWREFEPMAKSIYQLKERFGLKIDSYGVFLRSRYGDMWVMGDPDKISINARNLWGRTKVKGISDFFKDIDMCPREFWEYHNGLWDEYAKKNPNVIVVKYDDVLRNLDAEMNRIAEKIGCDKREFKNIEKKIGYWK